MQFFIFFCIVGFIFVEPMRFDAFMTYDNAVFLNNHHPIGFKVRGKFCVGNWVILSVGNSTVRPENGEQNCKACYFHITI